MRITISHIVHIVLFVSLIAALVIAGQRFKLENRHRKVAIVLDMEELTELAAVVREPLGVVLRQFKEAGATGAALSEMSLRNLIGTGRVAMVPATLLKVVYPQLIQMMPPDSDGKSVLVSTDVLLLRHVRDALQEKYGLLVRVFIPSSNHCLLWWEGTSQDMMDLPMGLDPQQVEQVRATGLEIVARFRNYPGINPQAVRFLTEQATKAGARAVIFEGEEVLGFEDMMSSVANELRRARMAFGLVEFARQRGEISMALKMNGQVLRVHSISKTELPAVSEGTAVQRFVRAAKERNVRICYVRLFPQTKAAPLKANLNYVAHLKRGLERNWFEAGFPRPFPPRNASKPLRLLIALGGCAGLVWLIRRLHPIKIAWQLGLLSLGSAIAAVLIIGVPDIGLKLIPLGIAVVFPLLSLLECGVVGKHPQTDSLPAALGFAFERLLLASLITFSGALLIVGLLFDVNYMLQIKRFVGVKASHALPLLILLFILLGGWHELWENKTFAERWVEAKKRWGEFWRAQLLVGYAVTLLIVACVLAYLIVRTGHETGFGVLGWELKLRDLFERLFIVRPRTKEWTIGHPALILAAVLLLRGGKQFLPPLLLIALIGQISIMNSFAHIHTPLWVTCVRTANGIWLGYLIGALACFLLTVVPALSVRRRNCNPP